MRRQDRWIEASDRATFRLNRAMTAGSNPCAPTPGSEYLGERWPAVLKGIGGIAPFCHPLEIPPKYPQTKSGWPWTRSHGSWRESPAISCFFHAFLDEIGRRCASPERALVVEEGLDPDCLGPLRSRPKETPPPRDPRTARPSGCSRAAPRASSGATPPAFSVNSPPSAPPR